VVSQCIGDKNILPYMHVILAYLFGHAMVDKKLVGLSPTLSFFITKSAIEQ
jgi:hypothetical protein